MVTKTQFKEFLKAQGFKNRAGSPFYYEGYPSLSTYRYHLKKGYCVLQKRVELSHEQSDWSDLAIGVYNDLIIYGKSIEGLLRLDH